MRIFLLAVLIGLVARAADAPLPKENFERMETRYFFLHPTMIEKGSRKAEKDPMPPGEGEKATVRDVGNAREYLEGKGVTFPPGATMSYSARNNLLVVRNTGGNLRLIDAITFFGKDDVLVHHIRIETRLVEFQPTAAGQLEMVGTFADLSKKLGGKVKTVYANQIMARSGYLAEAGSSVAEISEAPARPGDQVQPRIPGEPQVSYEMQIDAGGISTLFHVEFAYTLKGSDAPVVLQADEATSALVGRITKVKVFPAVAGGEGGAAREFALLMRCEILEADGRPVGQAGAGNPAGVELVVPPENAELQTRFFRAPARAWAPPWNPGHFFPTVKNGVEKDWYTRVGNAAPFFEARGIGFPPGASALYYEGESVLGVTNTAANVAKVEKFLRPGFGEARRGLKSGAKFGFSNICRKRKTSWRGIRPLPRWKKNWGSKSRRAVRSFLKLGVATRRAAALRKRRRKARNPADRRAWLGRPRPGQRSFLPKSPRKWVKEAKSRWSV